MKYPGGRVAGGLQTRLVDASVSGELFNFAPSIEQFLKVHLFGNISAGDNLDLGARELATAAAHAAMPGLETQLEPNPKTA